MEPTNILTAEQLFWGHDGLEYTFLSGASSPYASEVELLCASIGTPDGTEPEPFLLSMPYKDKLFWVRCCKGTLDKSQRPTLFFHILVVGQADVQRLGVNAFDVMESNCFSNSIDFRSSVEIRVSSRYVPNNSISSLRIVENRVIISNQPEPDAVFPLVRERINQCSWATYSYRFMDQMAVSVLSDKAPLPDFVSPKFPVYSVNAQKENNESSLSPTMKKLFIGSLILNVVLLLGYFVLPGPSPANSDATLQQLRNKLPEGVRFTDKEWEEAKTQTCLKSVFDSPKENENANNIDEYVKFVNKNILQERK